MERGYTISGLAVGFIVGVAGVGGGSLMTSRLIRVFYFAGYRSGYRLVVCVCDKDG